MNEYELICRQKRVIQEAQAFFHEDGYLEVDDDADVIKSGSTGFWVQAWIYIPKEDLCDDE